MTSALLTGRTRWRWGNRGRYAATALQGRPVPDPAPVALWRAAAYDGVDDFLRDLSGNKHHLKIGSVFGAQVQDGALNLPGAAGNYVSTPNAVGINLTGNLDIRIRYRGPFPPATQRLAAKDDGSAQRAWLLSITTVGILNFSRNGAVGVTSSTLPDMTTTPRWLRVTYNAATGETLFYHSLTNGNWTALTVTGGAYGAGAAINSTTSPLIIGSWSNGSTNNLGGFVSGFELRNGIDGTVVANFDPTGKADGTTSWVGPNGNTWTIVRTSGADTNDPLFLPHTGQNYVYLPGSAGNTATKDADATVLSTVGNHLLGCTVVSPTSVIDTNGAAWTIARSATGRKSVIVDRPLFLFGGDDYLEAPHHADLEFAAEDSVTVIAAYRDFAGAGIVLSKNLQGFVTSAGYLIYFAAANAQPRVRTVGTAQSTALAPLRVSGVANSVVLRRRAAADLVDGIGNGVVSQTVSENGTTLTNVAPFPLRIGRFTGTGTTYNDMEFLGAAIYRQALTGPQINAAAVALGAVA